MPGAPTPTDALIREIEALRPDINRQVTTGSSYQIRVWVEDGRIRVTKSVKQR